MNIDEIDPASVTKLVLAYGEEQLAVLRNGAWWVTCPDCYGTGRYELPDDVRCTACDELHGLMHLDPDVTEVLTREPWCVACLAGDKPKPDVSGREEER